MAYLLTRQMNYLITLWYSIVIVRMFMDGLCSLLRISQGSQVAVISFCPATLLISENLIPLATLPDTPKMFRDVEKYLKSFTNTHTIGNILYKHVGCSHTILFLNEEMNFVQEHSTLVFQDLNKKNII